MNRTALIVALVVAAAGAGLLYMYKQQFEENAVGGAPVGVIMAIKEIPPGTPITEDLIGVRHLPEAYVEGRHIKLTDKENIIGVRTANQIKPNETIQWTDLATGASQATKLSTLVRVGMRAATVSVDGVTSSNLLVPGDRIDLSLTVTEPAKGGPLSMPFMQNILVVAVGAHFGDEGPADARLLTVTLSPEAAQRLMLAPTQGKLTATLRNPDDVRILDNLAGSRVADVMKNARPIATTPIIAAPAEKSPAAEKAVADNFAAAQASSEALLKKYLDASGAGRNKSKR